MMKSRRRNSAPMCDLQFAMKLKTAEISQSAHQIAHLQKLATILYSEADSVRADETGGGCDIDKRENPNATRPQIADASGPKAISPRWALLATARGIVAEAVSCEKDKDGNGPLSSSSLLVDSTTFDFESGGEVVEMKVSNGLTEGTVERGSGDFSGNLMRPCLRQDAQSYLRRIAHLEKQLKNERENGRQLVLAHHRSAEELNRKIEEKEENLRQAKNQHDRVKEAYDQIILVVQAQEASVSKIKQQQAGGVVLGELVSDTDDRHFRCESNDTTGLRTAYERSRSQEEHYRRKYEEANRVVKELRDKLAYNGLGDTPTSTKFSYTITEYEEVRQALLKKTADYSKLQENLASNAAKWGSEIKGMKATIETLTRELEKANTTLLDLNRKSDSDKAASLLEIQRVEREAIGRQTAVLLLREEDARKSIALQQSEVRMALENLKNVSANCLF